MNFIRRLAIVFDSKRLVPCDYRTLEKNRSIVVQVLLVGSSDFTVIGRPILSPHFVRVEGMVIEKTLSQTQMHFWYAPRKKQVGKKHYRQ